MNPAQRDRAIAELKTAVATLEMLPVITDCRECEFFNQQGVCEHYLQAPPESFYTDDCPEWCEAIPF